MGGQLLRSVDNSAGVPTDPIILSDPSVVTATDISFEADVQILDGAGTNAGLVFRAEDRDNLYLFRINTAANTAALFVRENGTYNSLGSTGIALADNTWYNLKVLVAGDQIRTYVDDVLMQAVTDTTFEEGAFGFRTHLTRAEFDNVTLLDGPFSLLVDNDATECPDADFSSIQEAIDFSPEGGTIFVCGGAYDEQLSIDKDLTIDKKK